MWCVKVLYVNRYHAIWSVLMDFSEDFRTDIGYDEAIGFAIVKRLES